MKAVCWYGIRDVRVLDVPEPRILNPRDAIIEVTSTAICGSDLHIYDGYVASMRQGDILGHEFMGRVVEVGSEVTKLRVGDRVVVPFTISCGECFFCRRALWSLCDNSNPNAWMAEKVFGYTPAGLYGYSHLMGGYAGGQAEYVRVPFADVGPLRVPDHLRDEQVLLISDVFATGYMAAEACDIQPGDTVAVWGCGPVGQLALRSAVHLGAARVIAIDTVPERLAMAERHAGAETIDFAERRNVVQALKDMTAGRGPDACIEAVGMESVGHTVDALYDRIKQAVRLETGRPHALREAIQACRKGGVVSIAGVYIGWVDKIPMGAAFNKGLTLKMGQTHVQKYMPTLLDIVQRGAIDPSYIFTHTGSLDEAPDAYARFAAREQGYVKVMLKPQPAGGANGRRAQGERIMMGSTSGTSSGRGSAAQRAGEPRGGVSVWEESDLTPEAPPVPSQAEGSRATVDEDLCEKGLLPQEECEALVEEPEHLVTERRLPSQAEGERETVEENLRLRDARERAEPPEGGIGQPVAERRLPSQAEGERETIEEDLHRQAGEATAEAPRAPTGPRRPAPGEVPPETIEETVGEHIRRMEEEAEEPRDTLDEDLDEERRRER